MGGGPWGRELDSREGDQEIEGKKMEEKKMKQLNSPVYCKLLCAM